jgi:DNA polymerase III delta prime subunit
MIREHILWVEKYRPTRIDDCILPESLKKIFKAFRDKNIIPNMTLTGTAGIGKTTIAKALCDELDADSLLINCSENGNIDTLRNDIRGFASTVSMTGSRKVVIMDEADGLTKITQQALRPFIEEFAGNCSFILTCNYPNQIIEAIRESRCPIIAFKPTKEDKKPMAIAFHKRLVSILKAEGVEYDNKVLGTLVMKFFPDFRAVLGQLQKYSHVGRIDDGILTILYELPTDALLEALKAKDFQVVRKWVTSNVGNEPQGIYRQLFNAMEAAAEPKAVPILVIITGDYIDKASRSLDQEITLLAYLTCVMSEIGWK